MDMAKIKIILKVLHPNALELTAHEKLLNCHFYVSCLHWALFFSCVPFDLKNSWAICFHSNYKVANDMSKVIIFYWIQYFHRTMSRTALSHPNFFVVFILSIIRIIVKKFHSLRIIYKERLFKLLTEKGRHILWLILLCKFEPASYT